MTNKVLVSMAAVLAAASLCLADTPDEAKVAAIKSLVEGLHPKDGTIELKDGLAKIVLPPEFRYLDSKDTETVLVKLWGNPPGAGDGTLGMLYAADAGVVGPESWAVTIQYEEDGYVKDDDAASIDYDKLLKEMQKGTHDGNAERKKQGYAPIDLVGWASPPRYDHAAHKLHWAKELSFEGEQEHVLNYNIRMLGRRGVLVLNAIGNMGQLKTVSEATPKILSMVEFSPGQRYEDFKSGTDHVATYGLAALVAGGVAAKMGFFKVFWVGLLAAKKFIIIGIAAGGSWIAKLLKRNKQSTPTV